MAERRVAGKLMKGCFQRRLLGLLIAAQLSAPLLGQQKTAQLVAPGPARLAQLVEANIVGVHAYQISLARKEKNMDAACWLGTNPNQADLETLVAHQTSLLSAPAAAHAWALGAPSTFDPAKDLQSLLSARLPMPPNLPVNLFAAYLNEKAPQFRREEIRSIANLYQTVLEVERDGDRLQDLYSFYIALGLPVYMGQFGLAGTDENFLRVGKELEARSCESPVGVSAGEWQIAGRKIWNWGEKNLHIRDAGVLANELLAEKNVQPLIPRMRSLPS